MRAERPLRTGDLVTISDKHVSVSYNNNNILFLGPCQEHAVRMLMTCDEGDNRGKNN